MSTRFTTTAATSLATGNSSHSEPRRGCLRIARGTTPSRWISVRAGAPAAAHFRGVAPTPAHRHTTRRHLTRIPTRIWVKVPAQLLRKSKAYSHPPVTGERFRARAGVIVERGTSSVLVRSIFAQPGDVGMERPACGSWYPISSAKRYASEHGATGCSIEVKIERWWGVGP